MSKIKSIKIIPNEEKYVYNLEVQDNHNYFVNDILVSNCHLAKAQSLVSISKACINAKWRIGLSGSPPKEKTASWFSVVGATGPIEVYSTYKKLQDDGQLAKLKINMMVLDYPESYRIKNYHINEGDYPSEGDYINAIPERNIFIRKLVESLEGNTIVFFQKKEKHGYIIHEELKKCKDKNVLYVDGDNNEHMDYTKNYLETHDDCVLIGSNVLVTGINIKRIHNIVFAFMGKSMVKVKQAIGRSLRLHETKDCATLYDICDNLKIKISKDGRHFTYTNFSYKHAKERMLIYKEMGFDTNIIDYKIRVKNEL